MNKKREQLISVLSSLLLIVLWYLASISVNSEIILPSPASVIKGFLTILSTETFAKNVGFTILRTLESFVIIVLSGTVLGILAGKNKNIRAAFKPLITVFKAVPVMSIILVAFIWFRTGAVPVFSAFLMAFPVMFVQMVSGYDKIDPKLEEMCSIYRIEGKERIKNLVIPSLLPFIVTGARQTLSMIWKVVIAAEVLTVPKNGVGRAMQLAQIQLETSQLFAWTFVAIVLTAIGDYLFNTLLRRLKNAD